MSSFPVADGHRYTISDAECDVIAWLFIHRDDEGIFSDELFDCIPESLSDEVGDAFMDLVEESMSMILGARSIQEIVDEIEEGL